MSLFQDSCTNRSSLLSTSILADYTKVSCPTITKATSRSDCPPTTPSSCPQPFCIVESRIPVPCGCPITLPTTTSYTACSTRCLEGCGTYFSALVAPCSSTVTLPTYTPPPPPPTTTLSTITAQPSFCSTITISEGPECWNAGCGTTYSRCETTKTVTLECGCQSIPTVTSCKDKKKCDGGCITSWQTGYLPCPTTPWGPPPTSISYGV
ncbi:uncharacterized protein LY89DRAFT_278469 [Mollisia scopiformis]|uniref:Uncharacterized protein n=1 Tax=Mollisia scopiformis TaxID=149040 RepID=A0A132BBQ4_MOLSC|nr:uncharacterized protein LY89DRAFT_278469 [Mollisia scopiformis]KUJ09845.1 hypothetical protein LY89DRAFT_278469 [Mollisia scopiformis]